LLFSSQRKEFQIFSSMSKNETFARSHQCFKQFLCRLFPISEKIFYQAYVLPYAKHPTKHIYQNAVLRFFQTTHFRGSFIFKRRSEREKFSKIRISNQLGIFPLLLNPGTVKKSCFWLFVWNF
jgi:hypothetical protein